jgi:hypoxanthine phosphoribosyltransferase
MGRVFEKRVNIDVFHKMISMITIRDKSFTPLISRSQVESRIGELAAKISSDYEGRCPLFIVVLNGAFVFATDLVKSVPLNCEITFVRLSSYIQTESAGQVRQIIGLEEKIAGRDVIIIEDIVDTGLTMEHLLHQIQQHQPQSIAVATLLYKPTALKTTLSLHYVGFEIENRFVVGYGLDYDGIGRNLDAIYVLAQ